MKFKFILIFCIVCAYVIILISCVSISNNEKPVFLNNTNEQGCKFKGAIYDLQQKPLQNEFVRLAKVYHGNNSESIFVLDLSRSPSAVTDNKGNFFIDDVDEGEYLFVIGKPEDNDYVIYRNKNNPFFSYFCEDGKVIDVGILNIEKNFIP